MRSRGPQRKAGFWDLGVGVAGALMAAHDPSLDEPDSNRPESNRPDSNKPTDRKDMAHLRKGDPLDYSTDALRRTVPPRLREVF